MNIRKTLAQKEALSWLRSRRPKARLRTHKVHEDGDLTIKQGSDIYVVDTEGIIFKNVQR